MLALCGYKQRSKICASSFAFPVAKSGRFETFNLDSVLLRHVVICVGEWFETLHGVVQGGVVLPVCGQVLELKVLLLFQHGIRVDVGHHFLLLELGWVYVFTDAGLFEDCVCTWLLLPELCVAFLGVSVKEFDHLDLHEAHAAAASLEQKSSLLGSEDARGVLLGSKKGLAKHFSYYYYFHPSI